MIRLKIKIRISTTKENRAMNISSIQILYVFEMKVIEWIFMNNNRFYLLKVYFNNFYWNLINK